MTMRQLSGPQGLAELTTLLAPTLEAVCATQDEVKGLAEDIFDVLTANGYSIVIEDGENSL